MWLCSLAWCQVWNGSKDCERLPSRKPAKHRRNKPPNHMVGMGIPLWNRRKGLFFRLFSCCRYGQCVSMCFMGHGQHILVTVNLRGDMGGLTKLESQFVGLMNSWCTLGQSHILTLARLGLDSAVCRCLLWASGDWEAPRLPVPAGIRI